MNPRTAARPSLAMTACLWLVCMPAACGTSEAVDQSIPTTVPGDSRGPRDENAEDVARNGEGATPAATVTPHPPNASRPPPPLPDLYDPAIVRDIELTFDDAALRVLSNPDPATKETWVHASFKIGDISFADVGVRRKGSFSYRVLPQKASFKIKLNKWVSGQKIYGHTELTLNNMVRSPTCIAERLTFWTFGMLGLPSQKANTVHVTINGENYGVYANIETPNRAFLERAFGSSKANTLYEGNWGSEWLPGLETYFEIDVADPDAAAGTRPDLSALFRSVQTASDATLLDDVAPHLHTKAWLRFAAAEALTAQRDGYAYGDNGSHNYFMAGDTDGKFTLVPWSVDTTLTDFYSLVDVTMPTNATLLTRCKMGAACWSAYKAEVKSVIESFETVDVVALARRWHDQIDALVRDDPKREVTIATYEDWTERLYVWLEERPRVLRMQFGL